MTSLLKTLTEPLEGSILRSVFYIKIVDKVEMVDKMKSERTG